MKIYNYGNKLKSPKEIEKAKMLREKNIASKMPKWKEEAMPYVVARELTLCSTRSIGKMLGTSENVIKKFERGEPIERKKLIAKSYTMALNFIYSNRLNFKPDTIYSPIALIEKNIEKYGMLGIRNVEDAVNRANKLYEFNWILEMHTCYMKKIAVEDEDNGNYFLIALRIL